MAITRTPTTDQVAEVVDCLEDLLWLSRNPAVDQKAKLRGRYRLLMDALGKHGLIFPTPTTDEGGVPVGAPGIKGWGIVFSGAIGHAGSMAFALRNGDRSAEDGVAAMTVWIREELAANRREEQNEAEAVAANPSDPPPMPIMRPPGYWSPACFPDQVRRFHDVYEKGYKNILAKLKDLGNLEDFITEGDRKCRVRWATPENRADFEVWLKTDKGGEN